MEEVEVLGLNYKYLNALGDADVAKPVKLLEQKVAAFDIKSLDIDISYLFSTSNVRNPLENTIRFSLAMDIGNYQAHSEEELQE